MKIEKLIELLMECPMEAEVNLALNSACCGEVSAIRAKEDEVWIADGPTDIGEGQGKVIWESPE